MFGLLQQRVSGEQHARRADPALRGAMPVERLLQPGEDAVPRQPLDRDDAAPFNLADCHETGADLGAVTSAWKTTSLAKNPTVGGLPARESMKIVITVARKGRR